MSLAEVRIVISYVTDISDDPEVYEGATTVDERMDKESEYMNNDLAYMIEAVQAQDKVDIAAIVVPVKECNYTQAHTRNFCGNLSCREA